MGLQEIAISTWGLFIAAFWLVVGTRYLVGGVTWNDTGYTTTAVGLNWLCFFAMLILVMEGFAARLALNDYVCEIVTGQKGSTVLDAMKHLSKISEGKQIWHNMCIIGYKCFLGCLCGLDAWMHGSPSFFSPFLLFQKKSVAHFASDPTTWDRDGADWNMKYHLRAHMKNIGLKTIAKLLPLHKHPGKHDDDGDDGDDGDEPRMSCYNEPVVVVDDFLKNLLVKGKETAGETKVGKTTEEQTTETKTITTHSTEKTTTTRTTLLSATLLATNTNQKQNKATSSTGIEMLEIMKKDVDHDTPLSVPDSLKSLTNLLDHTPLAAHDHHKLSHTRSVMAMEDGTVVTKYRMRHKTTVRLNQVKQGSFRKITCCSNRFRQIFFSALLFLHSFLYGWYFFVSLREVSNTTKYYGFLPPGTNTTSASVASNTAHRRMLLAEVVSSTASSSATSSATSSASSSASSSAAGPSTTVAGWHTCVDYYRYGAPISEQATKSIFFVFSFSTTIVIGNGEKHGLHAATITCSIHHETMSSLFVTLMTLVPLLTTTLLLIPTYLRLYAYQKGTCECCWLLMCVFCVHNARVQTTHVFFFGGSSIFSVVFVSILANRGGCKCLLHNVLLHNVLLHNVLLQLFGNVLFAMFCSQCSVRNCFNTGQLSRAPLGVANPEQRERILVPPGASVAWTKAKWSRTVATRPWVRKTGVR